MENGVTIDREAALRLARLLELLVVSSDRMGSYYADAPEDSLDREFGRWYRERWLFRDLAQARMELWDALSPSNVDHGERLIAELGPTPHWRRPGD
jgi:hypothetical protein